MVEYFTQQKNDTEIGEERAITVKKRKTIVKIA